MIIPSPINPTGEEPGDPKQQVQLRHTLADTVQWLERLTANEDFQRYLSFVKKGADATRANASNIDLHDPAKRDAYAQRHFGLVAMLEYPEKELASARATIKSIDEKRRAV